MGNTPLLHWLRRPSPPLWIKARSYGKGKQRLVGLNLPQTTNFSESNAERWEGKRGETRYVCIAARRAALKGSSGGAELHKWN